MKIKTLHLGLIKTNCYLLSTERAAVVIDPGFDRPSTLEFLNENSDKERLILLTHAHFDHIGGADRLSDICGAPIYVSAEDEELISSPEKNASAQMSAFPVKVLSKVKTFSDGDEFAIGEKKLTAMRTPGHTKGSACFFGEKEVFTGDTVFCDGYGRTDLYGGDHKEMRKSLAKVLPLLHGKRIYPGHGEIRDF